MSIRNSAAAIIGLLQQRLSAQGNFDISLVPDILKQGIGATGLVMLAGAEGFVALGAGLMSPLERRMDEAERER